MRKLHFKIFDIRKGEELPAAVMFLYVFFIINALMILKPVRNSLFLVNFGAERLPYVFLLLAFLTAVVSFFRSKLHRATRLYHQVLSTSVFSILIMLSFWMYLNGGHRQMWLLFGLYVWVSLYGVVSSTQFWLMANAIFNARQAKRLFGFLGAGAISGGIFGGYLTNYLTPSLDTQNMILVAAGFVALSVFLLLIIWSVTIRKLPARRAVRPTGEPRDSTDNPVKAILASRNFTFVAGLIWVGVCVGNLADYQFDAIASRTIRDPDKLTAFFGFWLSNLNVLALLIQLFLANRVIKNFGAGTSLFFLPVGLLTGTIAVMVNPALWTAILLKISDGAFKHSINRSGTELLFVPIPAEVKIKVKSFIDVVVKNLATGSAGLFLLLLTSVLNFSVARVGLMNLVLIVVWFYLIVNIRREYVNAFRNAIQKRHIDFREQSLNIEDASVLGNMVKTLDSDNERQIMYVLRLLEDSYHPALAPVVKRLASHRSGDIKAAVLRIARLYDDLDLSAEAKASVRESHAELRTEAVTYLYFRSGNDLNELLSFLRSDNHEIRNAALMCAAREWGENPRFRESVDIHAVIEERYRELAAVKGGEEMRSFLVYAARAMGEARDPRLYPHLAAMFNHARYPDVVKAAIISAGKTGHDELVPFLIRHLKIPEVRRYAMDSLARYGESVVGTLDEYLTRPVEDIRTRYSILKVLAMIGSGKSVAVIEKNLDQEQPWLRYAAIKALNKLRFKHPELKIDQNKIRTRILAESREYVETSFLMLDLRESNRVQSGEKARRLLLKAIDEKLVLNLERIFRLLGLRYRAKDMYDTYLGIMNKKADLRANAVEFLDNVLDNELKRIVIPLVEFGPEVSRSSSIRSNIPGISKVERKTLDTLLDSPDPWIKACTIYLIAATRCVDFKDRMAAALSDPNPLIKETARLCFTMLQ